MAGPKTELKNALEHSGGLPPPETKTRNGSAPTKPKQSGSRAGKKPVTIYYSKEAHSQLKILAIERDTTIQGLHEEALNDLFVKNGKPPIS